MLVEQRSHDDNTMGKGWVGNAEHLLFDYGDEADHVCHFGLEPSGRG
jgi:hypothetical protein